MADLRHIPRHAPASWHRAPRRAFVAAAAIGAWLGSGAGSALAQDTREAVIAAAQAEKAAHPPLEAPSPAERVTERIQELLAPKASSVYPYFGSVWGGGGATLGAGYQRRYGDQAAWHVAGLYSLRNYKLLEVGTSSPGHVEGRLDLSALAGWRDATEVAFYGLGMSSSRSDWTNFRFKQYFARGSAEYRPSAWSRLGGLAALEDYELLPGQGDEPSIETIFTPATAPALGASPTYVHAEATAAIDSRPSPGYARTGGYYGLTLHEYADTSGPLDFRRLDATIVQHIPILRETWTLSLRGAVQTTLGDEEVPYFLLPSLGSGRTLRGYHSWRFRDRHSLITSAEWRWFPNRLGMDMALFFDAGKVTDRREDLDFTGMAHDWGLGMRLHTPTATPVRIELARGSEGFNVVVAGGAAF